MVNYIRIEDGKIDYDSLKYETPFYKTGKTIQYFSNTIKYAYEPNVYKKLFLKLSDGFFTTTSKGINIPDEIDGKQQKPRLSMLINLNDATHMNLLKLLTEIYYGTSLKIQETESIKDFESILKKTKTKIVDEPYFTNAVLDDIDMSRLKDIKKYFLDEVTAFYTIEIVADGKNEAYCNMLKTYGYTPDLNEDGKEVYTTINIGFKLKGNEPGNVREVTKDGKTETWDFRTKIYSFNPKTGKVDLKNLINIDDIIGKKLDFKPYIQFERTMYVSGKFRLELYLHSMVITNVVDSNMNKERSVFDEDIIDIEKNITFFSKPRDEEDIDDFDFE
jgi:hypothetical protein